MDDLIRTGIIATDGMKAQATRLRVVSENLANADSLSSVAGGDPYRRKVVSFKNVLNQETGVKIVKVDTIGNDKSEFGRRHDPSHPAADAEGYVLLPNVNPLIELMDMREAQRSYEANLNVITVSRDMLKKTVDLLR
ncbi:MAG: flagellar basal body rod protein FlgC [Alphaproteobacteria bacterium]|nr:flagellar basal body rod protein FlgC [Alphaproteobacteria bacterium]